VSSNFAPKLDEICRRHVVFVMRMVNGRKSEAARVLGIGRRTLELSLHRWGEFDRFRKRGKAA
jgi:DNA-binding protein Fis